MKNFWIALRLLLLMSLITGVLYPVLITGLSMGLFAEKAGGSIVKHGGHVIGSRLIEQKNEAAGYFWGRPSAVSFNPLPSGGSNLGPISADLKKAYEERKQVLHLANPEMVNSQTEAPQDLLFASASGLDPEISPEASRYQVARVARSRGVAEERVQALVEKMTQGRQFGIFGEPRVNVLELNLILDQSLAIQ